MCTFRHKPLPKTLFDDTAADLPSWRDTYSKTSEESTLWDHGLCRLFGGCPLGGCPFFTSKPYSVCFSYIVRLYAAWCMSFYAVGARGGPVHQTFSPSQRGCKHLVHLLDSLSHCLFLHFDWSCLHHTMHEEYEDCVCNNWSEANGNE